MFGMEPRTSRTRLWFVTRRKLGQRVDCQSAWTRSLNSVLYVLFLCSFAVLLLLI